MSEKGKLGMTPGHVYTDHLEVTCDESVEHVVHHLRLAAMFYQSTPDDEGAVEEEVLRLLRVKHDEDDPTYIASLAFMKTLRSYYEGLRKKHGL